MFENDKFWVIRKVKLDNFIENYGIGYGQDFPDGISTVFEGTHDECRKFLEDLQKSRAFKEKFLDEFGHITGLYDDLELTWPKGKLETLTYQIVRAKNQKTG